MTSFFVHDCNNDNNFTITIICVRQIRHVGQNLSLLKPMRQIQLKEGLFYIN